ncbi:MAG: hypothetical protein GY773_01200 [Actinomycetia bacterium]|nr:hypothetical protein [Actinomycetes bacterium]
MSTGSPQPISEGPLGVIDLLDGAFGALRQRARTIVAIVAGLIIPLSLFQGWVARDDLGGASFFDMMNDPTVAQEVSESTSVFDLGAVIGQFLGLLVTAIAGVAVSRVVHGWFEGRDPTAIEALAFTVRRMGAILGAFVVIHLLQLLGLILLILPGLAVIVLSSLTSPVLAIEKLGPVESMKRSWELVKRRTGSVIGIILLLGLVQYGVSTAVGTLPQAGALLIGPDRAWPLIVVANLLTSIILIPVTGATMCLTYLDIRFRTEGLDLERRIEAQFGL